MDVTWAWILPIGLMMLDLLSANSQIKQGGIERRSRSIKTDLVQRLLDPKRYSKQDPPMLDRPTRVALGIYINSFYSISEQTMDYAVSMYLRQSWHDPRLVFTPEKGQKTEVRLRDQLWDYIWVPDTFFRNEKNANYHKITVHNRLLRVNATGAVWYVSKITATLACSMKLHRYPLDTQTCPIMFESFGYTMDTMFFAWYDPAVDYIEKNLEMPQFRLIKKKKVPTATLR